MKKHILRVLISAAILIPCVALILVAAVLVSGEIAQNEGDEVVEGLIPEDSDPRPSEPETEENEKVDIEAALYEPPKYLFTTEEIEVRIPGLKNEYKIAFVNDLHMIADYTSGDVTEDNMTTISERREKMFVTADGVTSDVLWPEIIKFLNYSDFDGVIFAGDMVDYCSNANILALKQGINTLKYDKDKIMYLRSDHDYGALYGGSGFTENTSFALQRLVLDGDDDCKGIDFDEFVVVGINQSYRNLSESSLEILNHQLDQDKPVILATHVPYYSEIDGSLEPFSLEVKNKVYYWSEDSTSYVPDERTREFIDRIFAEDSNVKQIVAAHMHASWNGYVTKDLKQHIFGPSYEGRIGVIHVTGGKSYEEKQVE